MSAERSAVTQAAMNWVAALDHAAIRAAMTDVDVDIVPEAGLDPEFEFRQSRNGEDTSTVAIAAQMRAIYTSDWFWVLAALCPNNRLWWGGKTTDLDKRRPGAPIHYPDYLMLFLVCLAGVKGIATYNAAVAHIRDPDTWAHLVAHMDQYVPEGWTRLSDLPRRNPRKKKWANLTLAVAKTPKNERTKGRDRRTDSNVVPMRRPITKPPSPSTLDYWVRRWRGVNLKNHTLPHTHEYYGLRERIHEEFRVLSMDQAQAMGVLRTDQTFVYGRPDRNQFIGFDGVVFATRNHRTAETVGTYGTGTGEMATGTKYGIHSTRVDGQRHSRVILDVVHIHKTLDGSYDSEQDVIENLTLPLAALANGGVKGLLVDSVARGDLITRLQRHGLIVVNYPHAKSNPGAGEGKRWADGREEKTHLLRIETHVNLYGKECEHLIYAVGGELMEVRFTGAGTYTLNPVTHVKYEPRGTAANGTRREYHVILITCGQQNFERRISLFHTDATSKDPEFNRGEHVRVYPPGSAAAKYLYGARNDTEARHADLKARVNYLPADRDGQMLRLLGAAIASNAFSWQVHLQAHGENNVIDNTA